MGVRRACGGAAGQSWAPHAPEAGSGCYPRGCGWRSGDGMRRHPRVRITRISPLRAKLLHHLVDSLERGVVHVLGDLLGPLRLILSRAADHVELVAIDVEDPERDHLVLVLDVAGVIDDRALGQAAEVLVAVSPAPGLAELVPVAALEAPSAEEHEHAFSSPRLNLREEPMRRRAKGS